MRVKSDYYLMDR